VPTPPAPPPVSPKLDPLALKVPAASTALVLVDVQTKLSAVMPAAAMAAVERNILILIELARRLRWPIVWSEQYPKGLGPTIAPLLDAMTDPDLQLTRIEKLSFACTDDPGFLAAHASVARPTWIVVGMESHVCVWQTARGLRALGNQVFVPQDAVVSRDPANLRVGLDLCRAAGAIVSSTETVVFDALGRAGTDDFRALSRLLK
jgi:nicotinamidase-related amidase